MFKSHRMKPTHQWSLKERPEYRNIHILARIFFRIFFSSGSVKSCYIPVMADTTQGIYIGEGNVTLWAAPNSFLCTFYLNQISLNQSIYIYIYICSNGLIHLSSTSPLSSWQPNSAYVFLIAPQQLRLFFAATYEISSNHSFYLQSEIIIYLRLRSSHKAGLVELQILPYKLYFPPAGRSYSSLL